MVSPVGPISGLTVWKNIAKSNVSRLFQIFILHVCVCKRFAAKSGPVVCFEANYQENVVNYVWVLRQISIQCVYF